MKLLLEAGSDDPEPSLSYAVYRLRQLDAPLDAHSPLFILFVFSMAYIFNICLLPSFDFILCCFCFLFSFFPHFPPFKYLQ